MFRDKLAAWVILAVFLASFVPTATAGGDYDEWFWYIEGSTSDEDGDGYNDTATVGYDPDTECDCDVDIYVYVTVYDNETGDEVDSGSFEYTINNGEGDWFEEEWSPEYNGTFDFNITLYDDEGYFEDYADLYGAELWVMSGSPDETINVENGVFDEDEDQVMNDLGFFAHVEEDDEEGVNITVWRKNLLGIWTFFNNGTTDDEGELTFSNVTSGEYMWDASVGGEKLAGEGGYAVVDETYTLGHIGAIDDWDGAGDYDDFIAMLPEGNGTRDDGYVEIYDENGTMVDNGTTDDESWGGYHFFISDDLAQGNYTHFIYEEQDGDLLQNGSFYSYGSTSTNYDEWFDTWDYETEDTNSDFEDDTINISFDPDTECDCEMDIEVMVEVFENETGDGVDWVFDEFTINGTADEWFSMNWTATENGSYDFNVTLVDEDWNFEDQFRIENVYLTDGGGGGGGQGDEDEWFDSWDYQTEDTNDDSEDDTIFIGYNPDTTCDCEINITVYVDVYDNETGDWVDWTYAAHTIYGTDWDWFEQEWTATENGSYDFRVSLFDDDYNLEDEFEISNVYLSAGEGGGGGGEDEWFDTWDYETDGLSIDINYDPDTTCDCAVDINVYIDIFNETGDWVDYTSAEHTIYGEDTDWFTQEWTADEEGTYDFNVTLYDEDWNLEDWFEIAGVELSEAEQNAAPVIDALNVADGDEGAELSLSVEAHDDDGDELAYEWDFGDGETASGENVKYTWADDGDYTVTVTVSDGEADTSESATVTIANVAPTLSVDGASSGQEAQARSFEADASDVDADTVTIDWDFGDGETASGDEVSHTWADDGTYTITVTASDEDGGETVETFDISISNRAPTLELSASATSGDEGDSFAFSAVAQDVAEDTVSVTWDFGDGETANGLAVTHTFTDDGTFVVEAIASDEDGGVTSKKLYIDVANVAPTLTNLQLPSSVKQGEAATVSIEATDPGDDAITITWNMGDGTTYTGGTVSHTYDKPGTYTVTVCATDDDGGEDCKQATIPIELLEQLEEDGGLLPGFGLLTVLSSLALLAAFRRR